MVFLGYDEVTKGFKCLDYTTRKIVISYDVQFVENQIGISNIQYISSNLDTILKAFVNQNQVSIVASKVHTCNNIEEQPL
jgi:hypothetical protein